MEIFCDNNDTIYVHALRPNKVKNMLLILNVKFQTTYLLIDILITICYNIVYFCDKN